MLLPFVTLSWAIPRSLLKEFCAANGSLVEPLPDSENPIFLVTMSVWNPENIKDVAESVGITSLNDDVLQGLCSDIEYRISQVLEEALKFMRHSKRSTLTTQDVAQALRVLDVEPLYGYESTRPLRFGEASIGPGQPLFYVEDEEVDFEKLINAPLPKVPREMTFTGTSGTISVMAADLMPRSTLACCRRRSAFDTTESYGRRFQKPRLSA